VSVATIRVVEEAVEIDLMTKVGNIMIDKTSTTHLLMQAMLKISAETNAHPSHIIEITEMATESL
jgi:hypothetical protein